MCQATRKGKAAPGGTGSGEAAFAGRLAKAPVDPRQEKPFSSFWLTLAECLVSLALSLISRGCAVTWRRWRGRGLHGGWKWKGEQISTEP